MIHVIETMGIGGAEVALANVLPSLAALGRRQEVVALGYPVDLAPRLRDQGITTTLLDAPGYLGIPSAARKLARHATARGAVLLHAHLFNAELAAELAHIVRRDLPVVVTFHNMGYEDWPGVGLRGALRLWAHRAGSHLLMRRASAVSQPAADSYKKHLFLSQVDVLPLPCPPSALARKATRTRDEIRAPYRLSPDDRLITFAGKLNHGKGHEVAFAAMPAVLARVPAAKLLVLGSGARDAELRALVDASTFRDRVIFHEAVPNAELLDVFASSELAILPSFTEGLPVVLLEAMSVGAAVVATTVGGIPELLADGAGVTVPPGDAAALADAMTTLLTDEAARRALVDKGGARARDVYAPARVAERWHAFHDAALARR